MPTTRRRKQKDTAAAALRQPDYRHLHHPFAPHALFSDDQIAAIHQTALRILEELGLHISLPEAQKILVDKGALIDGDMVRIGRDMVAAALQSAPSSFTIHAPNPARSQPYHLGRLLFAPAGGCPNIYDRISGRRAGDGRSYIDALKLCQYFDVLHANPAAPEPQDVPVALRHLFMLEQQLAHTDKIIQIFARGRGQLMQLFEATAAAMQLSDTDFSEQVWLTTVINSNSPRTLDKPMAQGLIDFARHGQMSIITPFCLAGAMAPITLEGALALQHAEALAGIVLAQMTKSGAPISYGGFSSNVDMKSGAPAFGTPEHIKLQIGSGQLARHIGLPWRSAAGAAANLADAQGAHETIMGLWGAMQGGASLVLHSAGWLEGGLTFGFEKLICDIEALQTLAETCITASAPDPGCGFEAIAEVPPGGHFFATDHTMARYETAFYAPLNADLSNHGRWLEAGGESAETRATARWQAIIEQHTQPAGAAERVENIAPLLQQMRAKGGADPLMD